MNGGLDTLAQTAKPALGRRLRWLEPSMVLWGLLIAILIFLVASPLVRLLLSSFQEAETGRFTLANFVEAYGNLRHLQALWNSLELGVGVALLAGLFGVPIAWAISRTDMPAKSFVRVMVLGAFIMPPYLAAISWILLAGPNAGWLNKIWMGVTGADHGVVNIYSMAGLILVVATASFPYVFVFTNSALDLVSSEMEDAANILGAGTLRTIFRVTLPLVFPAILGGLIISFLEAIALFGAPALIALPAHFHVVATQLWQFFEYPVKVEEAAAYAMPLLFITIFMFWLQRSVLGRKGYTAVTGKGGERRIIRLRAWRWVMFGYALFICSLSVLLPYIGPGASGICQSLGAWLLARQSDSRQFPISAVRAQPSPERGSQHLPICWRDRVRGDRPVACHRLCREPQTCAVEQRAFLSLPWRRSSFRESCWRSRFYAAYAPPPLALYGTATILILGFTTRFLPIAYASSAAGIRSINPEMEEAVRILGGGRLTAIRRVLAPLLKKQSRRRLDPRIHSCHARIVVCDVSVSDRTLG